MIQTVHARKSEVCDLEIEQMTTAGIAPLDIEKTAPLVELIDLLVSTVAFLVVPTALLYEAHEPADFPFSERVDILTQLITEVDVNAMMDSTGMEVGGVPQGVLNEMKHEKPVMVATRMIVINVRMATICNLVLHKLVRMPVPMAIT